MATRTRSDEIEIGVDVDREEGCVVLVLGYADGARMTALTREEARELSQALVAAALQFEQ